MDGRTYGRTFFPSILLGRLSEVDLTRENAEEERDKEARRNNIIIYRMKESAAASAELGRQDDIDTLLELLENVFKLRNEDGDITVFLY